MIITPANNKQMLYSSIQELHPATLMISVLSLRICKIRQFLLITYKEYSNIDKHSISLMSDSPAFDIYCHK